MRENLIEASENILSGLEVIKTMTLPCGSRPTPQGAEVEASLFFTSAVVLYDY